MHLMDKVKLHLESGHVKKFVISELSPWSLVRVFVFLLALSQLFL